MKRRHALIAAPALWLVAGAGLAQTPARPARIGVLGSVPYETWPRRTIFVEAMRERGWIEGTHFVVDALVEDGSPESRAALAAELVRTQAGPAAGARHAGGGPADAGHAQHPDRLLRRR